MKRKHILFISRWYPDRYDSMLGLFVQKHALAVHAIHDVSVVYVTTDSRLPSGKTETEISNFEGIQEVRIYFGKSWFAPLNAIRYFHHYLRGIYQCRFADLIHVHILTRAGIAALYMNIARGIPYIITEHWSRYLPVNLSKGSYTGFLRKLFTRLVVSKAGAVTTVTANLADAMRSLGLENNYFITPNVVDVSKFRPATPAGPSSRKKLVHVSCFDEPAKNIKGIISAVTEVAASRDDFDLILVGSGKDFNEVYEFARKTGLEGSRIQFTGLLEGDQLVHQMSDASVLLMFSNYENLPCTIVESMACGVPVISTDVGGIKEHLSPSFGKLIQPGDVTALKGVITELLEGKITFDRAAMRDYAVQHFSNQAIGELFHSIYISSGLKEN